MARVAVGVKPGSKRPGIALRGDGVEIRVAAAAREGAANEAVRRALASALGVPPRDVVLTLGASSRHKVFEIAGLSAEVLRTRLTAAADEESD